MLLTAALMAVSPFAVAPATAAPAAQADGSATVEKIIKRTDRQWGVYVYSPSMRRTIPLQVLRPADTSEPRPTLYLLNGAGGGEDGADWKNQTDIVDLFADKNVNVVIPAQGIYSYYTDWQREDPKLGRPEMWQTFLTKELPPVIDKTLGTNGVNSIGGLSMSAGSVLDLAIQAPGLYQGVASYSGCARTSDPLGQAYIRTVVEIMGGADATNMWGPYDGPAWRDHDPYLNAEKLRGLSIYLSTGNGLPGTHEDPNAPRRPKSPPLADQVAIGGAIEAATNLCTRQLADRLRELNIPATVDLRPSGTHSWGYWQEDLRKSLPQLTASLGL
ncbi:alpha/beta hydrolase [Rhodococcus sp. NPDC058514]|uniref:alpha/beta hydrolase n=1 Tax=unclassified Rhodococcus (in: high G+C Gram-positive bacteria) TaxID=192944 RepID=UPI003657D246